MSDARPTIINDRYELGPRIGRGGMADVFLARDLLLNRDVAIKVLFPEHAIDPNFVERFRREAQSVAGLNHPNIVGVYDWGQSGNTYFMAMEYVKGKTLADVLRRQKNFSPQGTARIAAEIASALAFAHRNGVVHRDIKPANVLMSDTGAIKVVDFGIARAMDAGHDSGLTQDGAVMGTATYFSPEQAKGEALDPRSDLYSLGIVMYELVAGKPPFSGDNALATAYKQVNDDVPSLKSLGIVVPPQFEVIIAKCLTKIPDRRYNNAEELRDDLRRFMNNEPTRAWNEFLVSRGQAQEGTKNLDEATTVMSSTSATATTVMPIVGGPSTTVMPTAMTPQPTDHLPEYDDAPRNRNYIGGAIAAAVVLIAGVVFVLTSVLGGSPLKVPDVVNMKYPDAAKILTDKGFIVVPNPVAKEGVGDNIVYEQLPAANADTKVGDSIKVSYNPPKAPVVVPAIQGMTLSNATATLSAVGLKLTIVEQRVDPTLGAGQIILQTPQATQTLPAGGTVEVIISAGAGQVIVPNVTGQLEAAAKSLLEGSPFKFVVTIATEPSATVAKGQVLRTDPALDIPVDSGRAITVYVSSGPIPVAVPAVKGMTEADAKAALIKVGLDAEVEYVELSVGNASIGKVISQGTASGAMAAPGTKIALTVGRAPVVETTVAPG